MSGIKKIYPNVSIGAPIFDKREISAVTQTLKEGRLSQGKYVAQFEKSFAKYVGTKYAVACNSGSSANLLIASVLKELYGSDGLIIAPAATFATAISPFIQTGLNVVCSDVAIDANLDPDEIEETIKKVKKTPRFLLVVHSLGIPCNMSKLEKIAKKYKMTIIEDCCESHGAKHRKKKVGNFGLMSSFSFFVAHNMTSGEGGIVLTNSKECYDLLRSFREFGRKVDPKRWVDSKHLGFYDERYQFDRLGFNFRMTDYTASFAIEQLKKLDGFNTERRKIVDYYTKNLEKSQKGKDFLILPREKKEDFNVYYGYLVIVNKDAPFSRKDLVGHLEKNGVETRPFFGGFLPYQKGFEKELIKVGSYPIAKLVHNNAFFIGCHPGISQKDAKYVCDIFEGFLKNYD